MKVADVLSIQDESIRTLHELDRKFVDMVFSLRPWNSIGKVEDPVSSKITAKHKLSYRPAFQWPHNTVSLYVLEYLEVPFMIVTYKREHGYGWTGLNATVHVLDWEMFHKLRSHFTSEEANLKGFFSVENDGEIEISIGRCRLMQTSSGYQFVPSNWVEKSRGAATNSLIFDDNLINSSRPLDSDDAITEAVLSALKAPNSVVMYQFRRLYHGFTAAAYENDGRAFVLDCILPRPEDEQVGDAEPLTLEHLRSSIRITEWGSASLLETARFYAENKTVPSNDEFVRAVSLYLDVSVSNSQEIVNIMMTTDADLFEAFECWCRQGNKKLSNAMDVIDFQSEAIVRNPDLLRLLPRGNYSLKSAREQLEFSERRVEGSQTVKA